MQEKKSFKEYLQNHTLIADGAMGTYYATLMKDDGAVSEMANLTQPDMIKQIHESYIQAGARVIRTNTFAANRFALNISKEERTRMIETACQLAYAAKAKTKEQVWIAGSIGPIAENTAEGEEEILEEYKAMIDELLRGGVDLILFETFSDVYYIRPLVGYIREKSSVYVLTNFCLNKNGYTKVGISMNRLLAEIAEIEGIDGCGFNCGIGSGHMKHLVEQMRVPEGKQLAILPNAGYPEQMHYRMVFRDNAEYFKENMREIKAFGVDIIGGCCGTTPEHIKAMAEVIDVTKVEQKRVTRVSGEKSGEPVAKARNPFMEALQGERKAIAVELDPPYDANYEKLVEQALVLKKQGVDMMTMADSPMGRSRVDSILMSVKLGGEVALPAMPHVCCRDKNMIAMRSTLLGAYINGIRNLLVVTGDPVPSDSRTTTSSVFDYNSIRLMSFIKEMNEEHFKDDPIYYGGALNYARGNLDKIIERMQRKIDAGCSYFLTQPAYSDEDIERLRYIRSKLDTKILCGIMPFVSYRNANFVKNEFSGIYVPDDVLARYRMDMTKEEAEVVGAELAKELIEKMSDFADGFYFMLPFNRVSLLERINVKKQK